MVILAISLLVAVEGDIRAAQRQIVAHYSIELPGAYRLKDVTPTLIDFALYTVIGVDDSKIRCTLYFGNHPEFPSMQWPGRPTGTKGKDWIRKEFRAPTRIEGLMTFRGLSYQGIAGTPFSRIHYFADHLSPADLKLVSSMLASITVAEPHLE